MRAALFTAFLMGWLCVQVEAQSFSGTNGTTETGCFRTTKAKTVYNWEWISNGFGAASFNVYLYDCKTGRIKGTKVTRFQAAPGTALRTGKFSVFGKGRYYLYVISAGTWSVKKKR